MITFIICRMRNCNMGIRKGRREAYDNLSISEEGDCPRCGGEKQPSSLAGYLNCVRCGYEWKDPNHVAQKRGPPETYRRDAELIEEFKQLVVSKQLLSFSFISNFKIHFSWFKN